MCIQLSYKEKETRHSLCKLFNDLCPFKNAKKEGVI